jgi:hypothetical protein
LGWGWARGGQKEDRKMKKVRKPIRKELPPVKLYLDDLESICAILKQKAKSIDITTEDYEVKDIKQLKNLETKKLHYLSIECSDPYITIEFDEMWARIYFAEDSTYNRGLLSQIEDVLNKRKVFLGRFLAGSWAPALCGMLTSGSFFATIIMFARQLMSYAWLCLALTLLFTLFTIFVFRLGLKSYSTIILLERKEKVSFWKRNSDQILVAIIAAIIGSLITIAALLIFNLS